MQIPTNDKRNAYFPVRIAGINPTALYDTGTSMSCMTYRCYTKVKDCPPLINIQALSMHSATGHVLCSISLIHYGGMLGNTQFMFTFT